MKLPAYISYFDAHGKLGRVFYHPGGRRATEKLLSYLPSLSQESLLVELGSGAGETARLILDSRPCSYLGLDASPAMLGRARQRIRENRHRAGFLRCDLQKDRLPLSAESTDVIIAESVMCVLDVKSVLEECHRVLKRGGVLAWNERIFGDRVTERECLEANRLTKKLLGVDAARADLRTASDWRQLAERTGFAMVVSERFYDTRLDEGTAGLARRLRSFGNLLLHPGSLRLLMREKKIARMFESVWERSEQWIFVARKE